MAARSNVIEGVKLPMYSPALDKAAVDLSETMSLIADKVYFTPSDRKAMEKDDADLSQFNPVEVTVEAYKTYERQLDVALGMIRTQLLYCAGQTLTVRLDKGACSLDKPQFIAATRMMCATVSLLNLNPNNIAGNAVDALPEEKAVQEEKEAKGELTDEWKKKQMSCLLSTPPSELGRYNHLGLDWETVYQVVAEYGARVGDMAANIYNCTSDLNYKLSQTVKRLRPDREDKLYRVKCPGQGKTVYTFKSLYFTEAARAYETQLIMIRNRAQQKLWSADMDDALTKAASSVRARSVTGRARSANAPRGKREQ